MKRLVPTGVLLALVLVPATASAQLPIDVNATPAKDTGGWVYGMAIILAILGVVMLAAVAAGFMWWAPRWAKAKREKAASGPPPPKPAPALAPPVAVPSFAVAAAEASAASIGEKAHTPQVGAVPVVEPPDASAAPSGEPSASPPAAVSVSGTTDVYETTLRELLGKGVPQKVAEARAKMAAKKAGG